MNSFLARLFATRLVGWLNFPLWELKLGLEAPTPPMVGSQEGELAFFGTKVRVATEWIIQSARRLFLESLLGACTNEPEGPGHGYPFSGGPLYLGVSGYTLERWGLWKRRLRELRKDSNVEDSLHQPIDEALEAMVAVEKEAASAISGSPPGT